MKIDLHTHTACSDGRIAPAELVRLARQAGIDVLAVTDHDTTDGLDEAIDEGGRIGLRVIPGIEVSSAFEGKDVHILGLGIDRTRRRLQSDLARLKTLRRERIGRICVALATLGVPLDPAEALAEAGGKSIGRKHVARAMVKKGLVASEEEAFGRYLSVGGPAYVPANDLAPPQAAQLVRDAGGVPVLAHPGFLGDDNEVERIIDACGVRGIEVYHQYDSPFRYLQYLEIARRRDLIATGGSDFHGDDPSPDAGIGAFLTPVEEWRRIELLLGI